MLIISFVLYFGMFCVWYVLWRHVLYHFCHFLFVIFCDNVFCRRYGFVLLCFVLWYVSCWICFVTICNIEDTLFICFVLLHVLNFGTLVYFVVDMICILICFDVWYVLSRNVFYRRKVLQEICFDLIGLVLLCFV